LVGGARVHHDGTPPINALVCYCCCLLLLVLVLLLELIEERAARTYNKEREENSVGVRKIQAKIQDSRYVLFRRIFEIICF
jgi:hypothetical protein